MIHTNNIGITNVIALQDSQISDLLKLDELAKKKQELENEEQRIKLYKLKGTYSDSKFRLAMLIRGVSLNEIYKLKALPISDNVTIVGPITFIEKTEEQHRQAQYYNDLLLSREQTLDDIKQALKRLEYVNPNDLKFSGVTVLEWLDMNYIAKKISAILKLG